MVREAIGVGNTVEEAFSKACQILEIESHKAEFEIIDLPEKKKFGLFGGSPAKVRAFIKETPTQAAVDYLDKIIHLMGVNDIQIKVEEEEKGSFISLLGEDVGFIIGHRGETLDALQYLSGLVANHVDDEYHRITLNIGNFREKRRETLESLGNKMAMKALKTGRNCKLEPMNPYERRIIHTAVQAVEGAKSWSEGVDVGRHVVIGPEAGERPRPVKKTFNKNRNFNNKNNYQKPEKSEKTYQKSTWVDNKREVSKPKVVDEELKSASYQKETPATPLYGRVDISTENED